jgi:hypothetical protein
MTLVKQVEFVTAATMLSVVIQILTWAMFRRVPVPVFVDDRHS